MNAPPSSPSSAPHPGSAGPGVDALILALATVAFGSMASIRIADPMLPILAQDFGGNTGQAAATITGFALAYGLMQLVFGPVGDRFGKLRVISLAALAASAGSLLCALAPSLSTLVLARFLTGACCAGIIPLSLAWIGDAVQTDRRQETLARFGVGTLLGLIAGQALGGVASDTVGWRGAFVLVAVLFAAFGWRLRVMALAAIAAERRAAAEGQPDQGKSSIAAQPARPGLLRGYALVARSGWSRFILVTTLIEGAIMFGALAFVPTWLHERFGFSLSAAGLLVASSGLGGLIFVARARRWIETLGERGLAAIGSVLITVGLCLLAAMQWWAPASMTATAAAAFAFCTLIGFGFYMLHNTMQMQATQLAPEARGTAVGLFAVCLFLGQAAGVAVVSVVAPLTGFPAAMMVCGLLMTILGLTLREALARKARSAAQARASAAG